MSFVARPVTALWRDALAQVEGLIEQTDAERAAALAALADTRPELHAVVSSLLSAQREAEAVGFLEPRAAPAAAALSEGSTFGAWQIEAQIGSGGMGEVWRARRSDGLFEGEVAIKTLHPWLARGALRERFLREAQLLGRISHPNIARLIDAGVSDDGAMYLVLEYVHGIALDQYCDEHRLDTAARLKLFLEVCVAVAHAQSHLIVHRDLKPSNILVNAAGEVKLLDFGVATLLEAEAASAGDLTRLTGRAFTPEFAAPEQLRGEPITTATDVYSLGVILYVLLTGQRPHTPRTEDSAALEHAVLHEEPPLPSRALRTSGTPELAQQRGTSLVRLRREVAGDLDNIVARALEKRPSDRYENVTAFAADIERHLSHVPVHARAASLPYRAGKFLRRNRLAVAVGGTALLAVIVGALVAFSQANLARMEAQKANAIRDFLVGVFERSSVAHPDGAKARKITAEELLAQSAQQIRTGLADSPEVRSELLGVMSRLYASLDMQSNAIDLLDERLAADRSMFGPQSLQVAKTLNDLAYSQVQIGEYEKAIATASQSLALFAAHEDEDSLEHAKAYANLAQASYRLGRGADVMRVNFTAALALVEKSHPHDKARIEALIGLARAANYESKNDLYLQYCEQAWALLDEGVVVADGIVRGSVLQCEGNALTWLSRTAEAEVKMRAAIEEYDRAGGPDHPFAAAGRFELGTSYMWTERRADAKKLLAEALASLERVKGPDDPEITAHARSDYASTLYLRGELAEAESQMIRAHKSVQGMTGMIVPRMDMNLGRLRTQQGRFAEASEHLSDIESRVIELFGESSWMHGTSLLRVGDLAIAEGRIADAQQAYSKLWKAFEKAPDTFNTNHAAAGVGLVRVALVRGNARTARELASTLLATIEQSKGRHEMPDEEAAASMLLGAAMLAGGDAAGARPYLERAVAMRARMDAPQSLWLAEASLHLARGLYASGDKVGARRLLAQAEEAHRIQGRVGPQYASLLASSRVVLSR